jgi:membrane protein DedA with SNARE-associated domain
MPRDGRSGTLPRQIAKEPRVSSTDFEHLLILFGAVFLHEDAAVLTAVYYIANDHLSFAQAFGVLFAGMMLGDALIFGIGRQAKRHPKLQRRLIGPRVQRLGGWLNDHLFLATLLCRVLPGTLFPLYVACGWFGVPWRRFLIATGVSAYIYLSAAMTLGLVFDDFVLNAFGLNDIAVYAAIIALVLAVSYRRTLLGLLYRLVEIFYRSPSVRAPAPALADYPGMPPVPASGASASAAERIPTALFYVPIIVYWIWLAIRHWGVALPTAANPHIETGGYMGESKAACLAMIGAEHAGRIARYVYFDRTGGGRPDDAERAAIAAAMAARGIAWPAIVKPDVGWRGFGVRLGASPCELAAYLEEYPACTGFLVQEFVAHAGEIAILYARLPGEAQGRVFSATFRYYPQVAGDGHSTIRQLIVANGRTRWKLDYLEGIAPDHLALVKERLDTVPAAGERVRLSVIGSNRVGGLYVDAASYVTPALAGEIDAIARSMPDFHFGRFDIKFRDVEALGRGEDFWIVEVNGAGAEAIHMWDPDKSLLEAYLVLFRQNALLFEIGARNRKRGHKPTSVAQMIAFVRKQNRLTERYPPSN